MNRKASLLSLHNALNISKDSMEQDCFDNLELQLENFLFVRSFYEVMVETWKRSIEKLSTGEPVNLKSIFKGQLDAKGKTVNPAEEELWNEFKEKLTSQATPILDDLSGFYESIGKNIAKMEGNIWEIQSIKGRMINKNDDSQSAEKRLADMSHELAQKRKSKLADFKNLLNQSASIIQESIEEQQEGSGLSYDRSINLYSSAKKPNKTSSELAQGRKENLADFKNLVNKASAVVKMSPDEGKDLFNNRNNEESAGSDMRSPSYFIKKDKDENPFASANKITAQPPTSLFGGPAIASGQDSQPSNQTGIFQGVFGNGNHSTSGMSEGLFKTKPLNQPENFQIDNSLAGERSPSRIQVSLDKQEQSVNLVSDDSQVNQQSRTEGFSPEKKEATLRASLQARDIGMTKQICEEIADLKNMFLTFMEQIGGMQPNVSDFSISNCSPIKEDDVKRQNDLMKTDTKNQKLGVGLFGNSAFTPSQTPIKAQAAQAEFQGSATKKLDKVLSMLRNLVDCHHQELDVLAKVMGSTPVDIMERSRLEEVYEKNKAAREAAREEILKIKKDEEKKNEEETIIEQKEKEEIENTADMLLEKVDFMEHMKSRQTVHNFVLMYKVLCKLLQGIAHSQMSSLRFVSKMKKNLIGDTQIKFVKKVKKFSDTIETQYKSIKATENRRNDPTGILIDPKLHSILLAHLELCNKQNKYFDKQMTELANLVCGTQPTVIPSSDRARRPIK